MKAFGIETPARTRNAAPVTFATLRKWLKRIAILTACGTALVIFLVPRWICTERLPDAPRGSFAEQTGFSRDGF